MNRLLGFKPLLVLSFGLATASVVVPLLILTLAFRANSDMVWAFEAEAVLGVVWVVVVAIGLVRYRARGLWMLLGAPILLWPVIAGLVFFKGWI